MWRSSLSTLLGLLVLGAGVLGMRQLAEQHAAARAEPPAPQVLVTAVPPQFEAGIQPRKQPEQEALLTPLKLPLNVQAVPVAHPPGTVWLDTPASLMEGQTYQIPVLLETGGAESPFCLFGGDSVRGMPYEAVTQTQPGTFKLRFEVEGKLKAKGQLPAHEKQALTGSIRIGTLTLEVPPGAQGNLLLRRPPGALDLTPKV